VPEPSIPEQGTGTLFSYRDFRLLLISMVAVTLATQMVGTAVAYQIYELTQDPLALGMVGLAEAVPFISLSLVGGHVADAYDRRRLVIAVLVVLVLSTLLLWGLARERAALGTGVLTWSIYGAIVLAGVCRSFLQPARSALSAEIVPVSLYARAIAVRTSAFQLSMAIGPALGGVLYAGVGPEGTYLASAILLSFSVLCMLQISLRRVQAAAQRERLPVLTSVKEGARFLMADRLLLSVQLLDLFAVLFGGATALLPVFASDILAVGSEGFGVLRAAPAVGAVCASLVLAFAPPMRRAGPAMLLAVAGYGVSMLAFALSRNYLLSVLLLAIGGSLDMVSVLVRSTLLQLRVPGHLLGRVSSINQIFIGSSNEIGAFESGVAAKLLGVVPSVLFGGTMTLLVTGVTASISPELRKLRELESQTAR
jgi:MFS family permease